MTALFDSIKSFFIGLLPASQGFPSELETAFQTFLGYLNGLNLIFPISTMLQILGLVIIYELSMATFHFVRFLINLIRGSGA